jgi:hypothetical protein
MYEKRHPLQETLLGKLVIYMQRTKIRHLSLPLNKTHFKMDQRSKCVISNPETIRESHRKSLEDGQLFSDKDSTSP